MVIGVIGAGAAGMAAALAAAENPDVTVVLMERQARVGKKLQATGIPSEKQAVLGIKTASHRRSVRKTGGFGYKNCKPALVNKK